MSPHSSDVLTLAPEAGSARAARRFVRQRLAEWGCDDLTDAALLCVSELVTNAVVHTRAPLSLTVRWAPPRLRVELRDHSRSAAIGARTLAAVGGPVGGPDAQGEALSPAASGRGLLIVAAMAATIGETLEDAGKTVWFELDAERGAGAGPAVIVQQHPAGAAAPGDGAAALPDGAATVCLADVPVGVAVASDDHLSDLTRELSLEAEAPLARQLLDSLAEVGGSFPHDRDWRERLRAARVFGNPRLDVELRVDANRLAALRRIAALLDEADAAMRAGRLLVLPPPPPVRRFRRWALQEIEAQLAGAPPGRPPHLTAPDGDGDGDAAGSGPFLDLADPVRMIARLRRERAVVETLLRVGQAVTSRLTLREVVQVVTDAAIEVTPAAFGVFAPTFPAGAGTVLLADATGDGRPGLADRYLEPLAGRLPVRSYLAVPVVLRSGEVAGGLFFGHPEPGRFDTEDARLVEGIAASAAIAIENARLYEAAQRELEARKQLLEERARVAATLQESLLPPELPLIPGLAVAGRYRPGRADVGGDFYDVFPLRGRHWGFIIGDVCGKGPAAAAKTALARYTLRTAAMLERRPGAVLRVLNDALLQRGETESFCSALFARLRTGDAGASGELVVAGHPRPLLRRAGGEVERLDGGGMLLGILAGDVARRVPLSLRPGEVLLLYTDGVTEARRGHELLGEDRLVETVAAAGPTAEDVAQAVEAAVQTFGDHDRADDVAILAVSPTT